MKKITKLIAASFVLVGLMASCATTSGVDKDLAAQTEKPAKEKKAKAEKPKKEKPAKAEKTEKSSGSEKSAKTTKAKKGKFDQEAYNAAFEAGDYATCLSMLNAKTGKSEEKNAIRNALDADMLIYLTQDYTGAGKAFLDTYYEMQQVSSSMTAGDVMKASLSSETSVKYSGSEYERYLAWSMRLASALNSNQPDVANGIMKDYVGTFMDEIQALRQKNKEIAEESAKKMESDEFSKAQGNLSKSGASFNFGEKPKITGKTTYENSPFFNYLGTVAYAVNNDFDHAADFASTYSVENVKDVVKVPAGKGHLEVVALSGVIGKRSDAGEGVEPIGTHIFVNGTMIPLYGKVAYPVFNPQEHLINNVRVTLSDGNWATALLIEDFDEAVKIDVNQKAPGAFSRSVFRNIVKNSVATASIIAAGEALNRSGGNPIAMAAAKAAFSVAVDAAAKAVVGAEKADTRQAELFPHKASAAGFSVAPGTYTVKIDYYHDNAVVDTKTIENVVVKEGKVSVAVSSCEK
jgi:predicted small secreted protein